MFILFSCLLISTNAQVHNGQTFDDAHALSMLQRTAGLWNMASKEPHADCIDVDCDLTTSSEKRQHRVDLTNKEMLEVEDPVEALLKAGGRKATRKAHSGQKFADADAMSMLQFSAGSSNTLGPKEPRANCIGVDCDLAKSSKKHHHRVDLTEQLLTAGGQKARGQPYHSPAGTTSAAGCTDIAVVKFDVPTYITITVSVDDQQDMKMIMVSEKSSSTRELSKYKLPYVTSCLTSGIWTVTWNVDQDSAWSGGSFSVEKADGTVLIKNITFAGGTAMNATFMVGDDSHCSVPDAGDTGADYSKCSGRKLGGRCKVGCSDGYTLSADIDWNYSTIGDGSTLSSDEGILYCTSSGYFSGTVPSCKKDKVNLSSKQQDQTLGVELSDVRWQSDVVQRI